ncbi:hypothetical protein [Marispirochaeta aestuarii]|uniref:hypothetical protein n=1 Tax=Marispirochaeta aestuarii TaxID=1963862 RepID=UPI002ABDF8C0|nr:hypothetical protein [Marispirochaeta aestuarii]
MKCREWKKIQNELDSGNEFSVWVRDHLAVCSFCSENLKLYRRIIAGYGREVSSPVSDRNPVCSAASRRKPALLTAAAVFMFMLVAGGLLALPRIQDAALRRAYFRELAESVMDGGIFEYAASGNSGFESSWFQ